MLKIMKEGTITFAAYFKVEGAAKELREEIERRVLLAAELILRRRETR